MRKIILKQWKINLLFLVVCISTSLYILISKTNKVKHLNERVIEINFWNPSSSIQFDTTYGPYKKVYLTGFAEKDSLRFIEIRNYLIDYKNNYKKNAGMHVVFGDNSKYGDFIKVLDYCLQENVRIYAPYKNNIWISSSRNMKE